MADLRGHGEVEGEEPGTQSEVIKPLQRTVENLGMTSLILNRLRGVG